MGGIFLCLVSVWIAPLEGIVSRPIRNLVGETPICSRYPLMNTAKEYASLLGRGFAACPT
jgi:hypothetical protein